MGGHREPSTTPLAWQSSSAAASRPGRPDIRPVQLRLAYPWFRAWVNGPAGQRLGLAPIPDGAVTLRMLRRTLAHELAYRPGGLLAAKIALKHVSVATTEGYAPVPAAPRASSSPRSPRTRPAATCRSRSPSSATTRTASCPPAPEPANSPSSSPPSTGPRQPGRGTPRRRRQRPARPQPAQQARRGTASRHGELLLVHRPVPGALPQAGRHAGRWQTAGRNVRLSALPASHPPPLPPASLGRHRHQHHRLHRSTRPHPDRPNETASRQNLTAPSAS